MEASLVSEILQLRGQGYGTQRISGIFARHGLPIEGDHIGQPLQVTRNKLYELAGRDGLMVTIGRQRRASSN